MKMISALAEVMQKLENITGMQLAIKFLADFQLCISNQSARIMYCKTSI